MKGNLSALKYVLNNRKQVLVMIISLALTFMTMYVINFLLLSTSESFEVILVEQPKHMAMVKMTEDSMGLTDQKFESEEEYLEAFERATEDIINKLEAEEGISKVFYGQGLGVSYQGIVGAYFYDFPLLSAEDIPTYIEHFGAKLIEGRMPESEGEVLVARQVLINGKMKLNGYMSEKNFGTNFTVVGVLDSEELICVGTPRGYWNTGWYFTVLCSEENSDMQTLFTKIGYPLSGNDTIYDRVEQGKLYKEEIVDQLNAALLGILLVVIVFLGISVLVAYVSFLRNRMNEYCLYTSIGYSRKEVYGMIMREVLIIFGSSIALGSLVTIVILIVLARFVLDPLGLLYSYFYPEHLMKIMAAFVAIIGLLQIPILVTIQNIRTIDKIEE